MQPNHIALALASTISNKMFQALSNGEEDVSDFFGSDAKLIFNHKTFPAKSIKDVLPHASYRISCYDVQNISGSYQWALLCMSGTLKEGEGKIKPFTANFTIEANTKSKTALIRSAAFNVV